MVKTRLYDQFLQDWNSTVSNTSKCLVYRLYKKDFCFEEYLDKLPKSLAFYLCKFRTMNHNMPIEKGRYLGIERNHRLCHLCNSYLLGDEYHYLFECTHFSADRRKYIQRYYFTHPNTYKLQELMNNKDISILTKLAIFVK